jgi:uncharacterized protein (UPF0276 family)
VVAAEVAEDTEMMRPSQDRVGLSWRTELAAGVFAHQDQIDLVEVIAEDWFDASRSKASALRTLAAQIPVQLHGTSAGLASAAPVGEKRLAKMARLVEIVRPEAWSEHLAFVRGGGWEIGHLAAVPRNAVTVENAAANVARAQRIVGMIPMVENIASLILPPASSLTESEWLGRVSVAADAPLLLDLHNLYANAMNFANHAAAASMVALKQIPLDRVGMVHIAGGRWISASGKRNDRRLLDDHLHPVPDAVFSMLEELAALAPQPLTVVLERDGAYPPMSDLLLELQLARAAMRRGRERLNRTTSCPFNPGKTASGGSSARLEALLARIYVDESLRARFLAAPEEFAERYVPNAEDAAALVSIDRTGLAMAARSFERKRQLKRTQQRETTTPM